jgi:CheY-like chemotaxis protein/HAMP domain-containing protein
MRLTLRAKFLFVVGATALSFLLVIGISSLIENREARELSDVEERLLPKLTHGPQIEAEYEALRRRLQDASTAQDAEALAETRELMSKLTRHISNYREVLEPGRADALLSTLDAYYQSAYDVAQRMIHGEAGEAVIEAATAMQTRQQLAEVALERAVRLDRKEVTDGFTAARQARQAASRSRLIISLLSLLLLLAITIGFSRDVIKNYGRISEGFARFARGDFEKPIEGNDYDEIGKLAIEANQMAASLKQLNQEREQIDWLKTGRADLANALRGELEPQEVAERVLRTLMPLIEGAAGALYQQTRDGSYELLGHGVGLSSNVDSGVTPRFRPGEGLVGQAAQHENITEIVDLPPDYLRIRSGLGEAPPRALVLVPLFHLGRPRGLIEVALFKPCSWQARELLESVRETIVIALEVATARTSMRALLAETERQAQRLGAQEQELRANNEELQAQQEELRQTNEELDEQRSTLAAQNARLAEAQKTLEQKAAELVTVSAYKSRFLANMSHELRTPLNSLLILSELMADNEEGNLSAKQVEYSRTIHSAGRDLLALINQVLDLSKIEAGKQQLVLETVRFREITEHLRRIFEPLAHDKGLAFSVEVGTSVPETIRTDRQRLEQVLTNLVANGIKFTAKGSVSLRVHKAPATTKLRRQDLQGLAGSRQGELLAFSVVDTGPGIPPKDQEVVFTPFERLETKSEGRFGGGTGLGLTIARELVALLGGELHLDSEVGKGTVFTFFLPVVTATGDAAAAPPTPLVPAPPAVTTTRTENDIDDRDSLATGDSVLLVIEDDPVFAERLVDIIHNRGFKALVAGGGEDGLTLARQYRPQGVILDVRLPDVTGWTVMDRLRQDPATSSIPVHFVSGVDTPDRGWAMGAVGYLTKPATNRELISMVQSLAPLASKQRQQILVLEPDAQRAESIINVLKSDGLAARQVTSAQAAFTALAEDRFVCLILDLALPDMDGLGFLSELKARDDFERPPVVVYTGRALTRDETRRIEEYAEAVVLKEGRSTERLLEEIRLFIHHLESRLPEGRKPLPIASPPNEQIFRGKRVLVVDDDMRTVYAMSALLRTKGVDVLMADNGRAAIEVLTGSKAESGDGSPAPRTQLGTGLPGEIVDAVLMDVMMPEMDGYEAMRRIRGFDRFRTLPIIALTAKAMKGEREKCLEAGASDYLSKPIDTAALLKRLATWLSPRQA